MKGVEASEAGGRLKEVQGLVDSAKGTLFAVQQSAAELSKTASEVKERDLKRLKSERNLYIT